MRNRELIQLLALQKSLVYFSTSLKSNEITLEKIIEIRDGSKNMKKIRMF